MAEPQQEVHKQIEGAVEGQVNKLAGRLDLERAAELGRGLDDMNAALRKVEAAVAALKVKKPEDAERGRELFKKEITEALTALRDTLQGHESDALFLVQETRHELEKLGQLAAQGPKVTPKLFGLIKSEQIKEWLAAIQRGDPQNTLNIIIGVTHGAVDEIATEVPTEGARRDGMQVVANHGTNVLARYRRGTTAEHLKGIEQAR